MTIGVEDCVLVRKTPYSIHSVKPGKFFTVEIENNKLKIVQNPIDEQHEHIIIKFSITEAHALGLAIEELMRSFKIVCDTDPEKNISIFQLQK